MCTDLSNEILSYFPPDLNEIKEWVKSHNTDEITEIRIRIGRPIEMKLMNQDIFLKTVIQFEDMIRLLENFCNSSIYAVQNEINQGYLTLRGGHRIGISGTSVWENNTIKNLKYISSMNIRIAREVQGCSEKILYKILENSDFENTLILSPPGCGKTTILRDMVRNLSDGFHHVSGRTISLIDERSEIAAMYKGVPQNDVGIRTDVMSNIPKWLGMEMMVRSMGPEIIATDEVGGKKDIQSVEKASYSGIKLLLTSHGNEIEDISPIWRDNHLFKNIIVLMKQEKPGLIKSIYKWEDNRYVHTG